VNDEEITVGGDTGGDTGETGGETETTVVQVVSIDELVERLTSETETSGEVAETPSVSGVDGGESEPTLSDQYYALMLQDTTNQEILAVCRSIRKDFDDSIHPAMTTTFADYTVSEALLLLALVGGVVSVCVKMLRRAFLWLG
jgi:hypothetical protein